MSHSLRRTLRGALLGCILLATMAFGEQPPAGQETGVGMPVTRTAQDRSTLDNLKTAYADEVSTQAQYVEFAKKADEEGYHQVASMFRAVARAEEIHANNYAELIRKKGGTVDANPAAPEVKSTRENLQTAVAGEDHDKDVLYPAFIEQARKDGDKESELVFNYTKVAESAHASIYDQALNDLDAYRGGSQNFVVCPQCGKVTVAMHNLKCPTCATPRERFLAVN